MPQFISCSQELMDYPVSRFLKGVKRHDNPNHGSAVKFLTPNNYWNSIRDA